MSTSQIQKLLDERNLSFQDLSEQTELSVESFQNFEKQIQKSFYELKKISDALNIPSPDIIRILLEYSIDQEISLLKEGVEKEKSQRVERSLFEIYCDLYPDADICKK